MYNQLYKQIRKYIFIYIERERYIYMCTFGALRGCALLRAPATLPDAAAAASRATQRSCNAPRRCNCCFQGHATLQQGPRTLQLLLPGPRNAPARFPDTT